MGRQIEYIMTESDEQKFLEFLNSFCDYELIEYWLTDIDGFYTKLFRPYDENHRQYSILNKKFKINPEYKLVKDGSKYYIANRRKLPLIEFNRKHEQSQKNDIYGRVFLDTFALFDYSKSAYPDFIKDLEAFYDAIVKWIKKNAGGTGDKQWYCYFLPDAWNNYLKSMTVHSKDYNGN